jgi:hypothetical protein
MTGALARCHPEPAKLRSDAARRRIPRSRAPGVTSVILSRERMRDREGSQSPDFAASEAVKGSSAGHFGLFHSLFYETEMSEADLSRYPTPRGERETRRNSGVQVRGFRSEFRPSSRLRPPIRLLRFSSVAPGQALLPAFTAGRRVTRQIPRDCGANATRLRSFLLLGSRAGAVDPSG